MLTFGPFKFKKLYFKFSFEGFLLFFILGYIHTYVYPPIYIRSFNMNIFNINTFLYALLYNHYHNG